MSKTVNRVVSGITCAAYVWLYAAVIYFTLCNGILLSTSGKAKSFFDAVFLTGDLGEAALSKIFVAAMSVMLIKTVVCAFQKELTQQSKVSVLGLNLIYFLSISLFILFSGNKVLSVVCAILCAAVLGVAVYANVRRQADFENRVSVGTANAVLCIVGAVVYLVTGFFVLAGSFGSAFADSSVLWPGILMLFTLIRVIYLTACKSLPVSYRIKSLVCSGIVIPAAFLAISDFGSAATRILSAVVFFASLVAVISVQAGFIKSCFGKSRTVPTDA